MSSISTEKIIGSIYARTKYTIGYDKNMNHQNSVKHAIYKVPSENAEAHTSLLHTSNHSNQ
jgi:hypothetical protein